MRELLIKRDRDKCTKKHQSQRHPSAIRIWYRSNYYEEKMECVCV